MSEQQAASLKLIELGIDTYKEAVIYMRKDCHVCRAEGFEVHTRIRITLGSRSILATLNTIDSNLLKSDEAALSKYAWSLLRAQVGDVVSLSHPKPLQSLSYVRSKIYGHALSSSEIDSIISDIAKGRYSDIHIATFLAACAGGRLDENEIINLTKSMAEKGKHLDWPDELIVDKHCVGGLPGNRTTLIIVPIVAAFGLTIPKTSSRAITSPAGTADAMEVLAPVNLSLAKMRKVVEQEQGCICWGGAVVLSPTDDILIRVEKVIDLDSEGQLIASVLSKKIAAGSTHIVIDVPIGSTAKIRSIEMANSLKTIFDAVSLALNLHVNVVFSDGAEPVGRGIGPALEAKDALSVLQNKPDMPLALRDRALMLAGQILEFSPKLQKGHGRQTAQQILESGEAWKKFQAICQAQGGLREPTNAKFSFDVTSHRQGQVVNIDNRRLARVAKLAGAPHDKAAGILLHASLNSTVRKNEPLFTVYAESRGELQYALSTIEDIESIMQVEYNE